MKKIYSAKATGIANQEAWTIGDVYLNRETIAAHVEQCSRVITRFTAGGGPACVYNKEVSISQLAQCWQHAEFRCMCPECGHEAYIYDFAGHITGGGYWQIKAYCPECDCGYYLGYPQRLPHWTVLKDIFKEIAQTIDPNTLK